MFNPSSHTQVTVEDATMAILLYEESLVSRLGYSVLNHMPTPHFRSRDIGAYIGKEVTMNANSWHVHQVSLPLV